MKLKDLKKLMREYSNSSDQDEFDVIIVNDVFSLSKTGQLNVTIVNDQKVEIHHDECFGDESDPIFCVKEPRVFLKKRIKYENFIQK